MPKVKIDDRASLEQAYPPDAFAADAARNAATTNEAVSGVRVLSAPDTGGEFSLERGTRQSGESGGAVFLVPYNRNSNAGEPESAVCDPRAGYDAFLDEIVEAARRFGYRAEESSGQDCDPRIRGPRQ